MKVLKEKFYIVVIFIAVLRVLLAFLPSFSIDMRNWIAWSYLIGDSGPGKYYSLPVWTDYTPGFLYYLWFLASLNKLLSFGSGILAVLIKFPVILADLGIGLLIFKILRQKGEKIARFGFLAYTLNPAVVFVNSIWGQTDGLLAFFLLLSAYLLIQRKHTLGVVAWAVSLLVKPQALAAFPILFIYMVFSLPIKKILQMGIAIFVTLFLIGLPFFPNNPIFGLPNLILKMTNESPFTSVMSFNFWALTVGMWIADSQTFLGISYFVWGMIMLTIMIVVIIYKFLKEKKDKLFLFHALGLSYLAFFLFPTRVHERYILAAIPFLTISALLLKSKIRLLILGVISVLSIVNIYYPYAYYTKESFLANDSLVTTIASLLPLISVLFLLAFFFLLFNLSLPIFEKVKLWRFALRARMVKKEKGENNFVIRNWRKLLVAILIFAAVSRFLELHLPTNFYFDEVYHGFTAREMLKGNKAAWEWWNTPPEGFAYEWTHPPLAKEGMVLGMMLFGENSLGWRAPGAILGVGSVYLIYLLAYSFFKKRTIALLSSLVFALDGLPIVMSRIGMNDSYFLFFALLSVYLFIENKNLFSSLALGLAAASKWSTLWVLPILFVAHFALKKKFKVSYLWFLILPPLVYLASYIPMFTSGHSWDNFIEVQKQMWWYHTRLVATHPFSSPWWSWPFLMRPIWLFTNSVNGFISNIYAMGNPIVFWFGLTSIVIAGIISFIEKNKILALVVFSYLVFFIPWAASPRIMFLYHYLPSIPFLAIATGYVLKKFPRLVMPFVILAVLCFVYFYPHWSGLPVPQTLDNSYHWFSSW